MSTLNIKDVPRTLGLPDNPTSRSPIAKLARAVLTDAATLVSNDWQRPETQQQKKDAQQFITDKEAVDFWLMLMRSNFESDDL